MIDERFSGKWHTHFFCSECDHEVTDFQRRCSDGCCPHCGHTVVGSTLTVVEKPMRYVPLPRKWWELWKACRGSFVGKGDRGPIPIPNRRAAVEHTKAMS
jgi:5-methylcytosine-specific restriction endonuclease McrA